MSYYQGDYRRGDYRRGDPGLFSFIGRALKTVGSVVGHAAIGGLTGGLPGAIVGAAEGAGSATARNVQEETLASGGTTTAAQSPEALVALHQKNIMAHPNLPAVIPPMMGGGGMAMVATGGHGMRRMHPNKSTYVTRGGGTSRWPVGLQVHHKGTEAVPSRRMNVANPRALRRALRRVAGFGKIVKRVRGAVMRAASAVGGHRRTVRKGIGRK